MRRLGKSIAVLSLIVLAIVVGSAQEWLKVNINFHLDAALKTQGYDMLNAEQREQAVNALRIDAPYDYYYNHTPISSLSGFDTGGLNRLKWLVTVFFVAVFFILNGGIIWLLYKSGKLLRWLLYLYVIFFMLSFLFYMTGIAIGEREHFYNIARKITGALQSLVPLMLVVPAWWISREFMVTDNRTR